MTKEAKFESVIKQEIKEEQQKNINKVKSILLKTIGNCLKTVEVKMIGSDLFSITINFNKEETGEVVIPWFIHTTSVDFESNSISCFANIDKLNKLDCNGDFNEETKKSWQ